MTATAPNQAAHTTTSVAARNTTDQPPCDYATYPAAREEFTAWLTASCERQGLPVVVSDATTLAAIATLLH